MNNINTLNDRPAVSNLYTLDDGPNLSNIRYILELIDYDPKAMAKDLVLIMCAGYHPFMDGEAARERLAVATAGVWWEKAPNVWEFVPPTIEHVSHTYSIRLAACMMMPYNDSIVRYDLHNLEDIPAKLEALFQYVLGDSWKKALERRQWTGNNVCCDPGFPRWPW